MDRNLLERFFYEGLIPREMCCPRRGDYKVHLRLCGAIEDELSGRLTPELKEMFEKYKEYASVLTTLESEESFIQGISLGIRMTAEAFTLEERKRE